MRIPEQTITEILQRADLADIARSFIELKKSGAETLKGCCPFHHEKTPSFQINTAKQVYHCFGCKAGGNVISFVKAMVNTDYVGAIRWLAQRYNITIPENSEEDTDEARRRRNFRDQGMRLLDEVSSWFQSQLFLPHGAEARQYLASRGVDEETIRKYRIGYAPEGWDNVLNWAKKCGYTTELLQATGLVTSKQEQPDRIYDRFRNRLMFTICDELSRPVAFSGRVFGAAPTDKAKYVNSPESDFFHKGQILYGFNFARQAFRDSGWALVCEGQLDVIACHRAGLPQAFAAQGTAFTEDHCRMLKRSNVPCVHLAFDGDTAGQKATIRTIKLLQEHSLQVMVTTIPSGEDPDSIFRTGGPAALKQIMSVAEPAVPFAFRVATTAHPNGSPEERSLVVDDMLDVISSIQDKVAQIGHCQWLAQQLHLPENTVQDLLKAKLASKQESAQREEFYAREREANTLQPPAFTVPTIALQDSGITALLEFFLDLAIHYKDVANQLLNISSFDSLPQSPVAQALTIVLAKTSIDEWEDAVNSLTQDEQFINTPAISSVFTASKFANCPPNADGSAPEIIQRALADCLQRFEQLRLEEESTSLQQHLSENPNDFEALLKAAELARRQEELRRL